MHLYEIQVGNVKHSMDARGETHHHRNRRRDGNILGHESKTVEIGKGARLRGNVKWFNSRR